MNAFHAYDIRGVYNRDFDKNDVYKIGFFLPQLLDSDTILVGRDVRKSSPEVFEYLCKGITDSGANVHDAGLATTPMIYYTTAYKNYTASVMITASHNAKEYNGLKISREKALPVGYDTGLNELEKMMNTQKIELAEIPGQVFEIDAKSDYLDFQQSYTTDLSGLNIGIDCSNGMAGLLIRDILGDKPHYIFEELDGSFPNHEANPLVAKNIVDLQKLVLDKQCDIGVIFDGDADRVMFVDEKGQFISPDLMIGVLGYHFFKDGANKGAKVLQDIRTSKSVAEQIKRFGAEAHIWRVGRAYAALKLREIDGLFGGELAGHYYFKDFYYSDSGLLAASLILAIAAEQKAAGKSISELIAEIKAYSNSGEINFRIEKKQEAMEAVKNHFIEENEPEALMDFDGYRVEFSDWWFSIRPSNTEPYLRLLVEAKNDGLLKQRVDKITEIIQSFA